MGGGIGWEENDANIHLSGFYKVFFHGVQYVTFGGYVKDVLKFNGIEFQRYIGGVSRQLTV